MTSDDTFTRNMSLPRWLVYTAIATFTSFATVAGGTVGGIVVVDRNQLHVNTSAIGELKERVGRTEEKTKDILDAINALRADFKEMTRRMP